MPQSIKQGISSEIYQLILLEDNEKPMYYYTRNKIHILLTDKRFIKIENDSVVSEVYLNRIKFVNHIKNSVFSFDKVEVLEESGRIETFGIYEKDVCAYFTNLLNSIVKEIKNKMIKKNLLMLNSKESEVIEKPLIELPKKPTIKITREPTIEIIKENICARCLDKYEIYPVINSSQSNIYKDICAQCTTMLNS